jgi:hypothetical protein
MDEVPRIMEAMKAFAVDLTAAGSRHGAIIKTQCVIGLTKQSLAFGLSVNNVVTSTGDHRHKLADLMTTVRHPCSNT